MPAKPPAPGALHCQFLHTQQGRTWSFNLFYSDDAGLEYTQSDTDALAAALAGTWGSSTHGVGRMHTDVTFTDLVVTDLFSSTAPRTIESDGQAGTATGTILPMNVAMVVKRVQIRRYRGGKGHVYLTGYDASNLDTDENFWKPTSTAAVVGDIGLLDAAAFALTSSHGTHYIPIVVSYFTGHAPRATGVLEAVSANAPQDRVCSRRRRLPKL